MSKIIIPANVAEVLRNVVTATRLVDEQGNVLGIFSPEQPPDGLTPDQWAEIKRRRYSNGPRLTTDDLLSRLEARENK